MTKDELKIWFWDKFNSCYPININVDIIYMIYDSNFIRAKKLANILDKEVEYPIEVKGICLFKQDFINEWFQIDYDEIWSFLEKNYSTYYQDIKMLINGWLEEYNNLNVLIPRYEYFVKNSNGWKNIDKLKIYKHLLND